MAAVVAKGELAAMATYPLLLNSQFQLVLLLASALGLTINHSTFVCTRVNEPLMTSVAGGGGGEGVSVVLKGWGWGVGLERWERRRKRSKEEKPIGREFRRPIGKTS